ncbi:aminopeptidase N [Actinocatenispora thailandica]|uniref:aminopeptidase N n=1 Tax=Actinocatenispora thailandica TaxID=227318 RepID=UPI00194E1144|nr:aminopeptidase N [Actinocatenispora thailandica]
MHNLARTEAVERARLLSEVTYRVTLDLTDGAGTPSEGTFSSRSEIRFRCAEPGAATFVEISAQTLRSATLNGTALDLSGYDPTKGLPVPGLAAENELVVEADCVYSTSGQGLHRALDPVDGEVYLYSQFETNDAQRVFACFDQPDLKARHTFVVTVPKHWRVVSNSPVADVTELDAGKVVTFSEGATMSTYVTAVCAGPYHEVRDEHDGIDLGVYCRSSLAEHLDADDILTITKQGFDFYHSQFGVRYPLPKYDQLLVPEYNAGAMENFGCITISEEHYLFRSQVTDFEYEQRANTILHELAHMWFGDLVTMRWWDDLWLNESFAEWASHWCNAEATRFSDAWTTFLALRKRWGYGQDQLPTTHPVYTDVPDVETVEVNFDGITYAKGASILKQIVAYVGRDAFVAGLRAYFPKHAWGNATFDDLLGALEEASGRELRDYASQWLTTAQVNTLRPEITLDGDDYGTVAVLQEAPKDYPTLRTHRLAIGLYDLDNGKLVRRKRVELDVSGERTEVAELAGERAADVLLVNDDDLTYAKIRLDERSMATIVEHVSDFASSLPRGLVWAAAQDMLRDAEMPARQFVRMVAAGIGSEADVNLVTILARTARQAVNLYADPAWQDEGRTLLASTFAGALRDAEPGSGRQLTFAQEYAALARTGADLAVLKGWLAGEGVPDGLTVDTDLRWHLLHSLVALGEYGTAEIDAELARDNTASGQRQASVVRASLPDADAKAESWAKITTDTSLPNWLQRAMLQGFWHTAQLELLAPYRDRYFADVADVWERFDGEVAQVFAILGYPSLLVDDATVAATDAWLAGEHPAPLRRLVAEGKDGVQRALRARACDTAAS